jgi:hypothetical protein
VKELSGLTSYLIQVEDVCIQRCIQGSIQTAAFKSSKKATQSFLKAFTVHSLSIRLPKVICDSKLFLLFSPLLPSHPPKSPFDLFSHQLISKFQSVFDREEVKLEPDNCSASENDKAGVSCLLFD